jgi:hypothetical protein
LYFLDLNLSNNPGEQGVQGFRQGGVGEDPLPQGGVGKPCHHGDLDHGLNLSPFDPENGGTEGNTCLVCLFLAWPARVWIR